MTQQPGMVPAFAQRPASAGWEQMLIPGSPIWVWAWFRPPQAPNGLAFSLPTAIPGCTLRQLLRGAGVDGVSLSGGALFGRAVSGPDILAVLDQPLPYPGPGADTTIVVQLHAAPAVPAGVAPAVAAAVSAPMPAATTAQSGEAIYQRIDADWHVILHLEKQMQSTRKQLSAMLTRLNSLNRELSPDERLHSDRQDKNDWQDAKRWIRDVSANVSRYLKEHDIGMSSWAGRRGWFEQTYATVIVPRQPVAGLEQMQRDFEGYRKTLQTLFNNMNSAYASAQQDGERRAQSILTRISAKIRAARTKRR